MTDTDRMVVWLREAMDAAGQLAEAAAREATSADWEYQHHDNRLVATIPPWFEVAAVDYFDPAPGKFMAANDPAAVLRRIAADRKMLELHTGDHECSIYDGPNPGDIDHYAYIMESETCDTVRLLAEGYGWTESRSTLGWPECMCTPSGECGNCWEKRQGAPNAHATKGEPR